MKYSIHKDKLVVEDTSDFNIEHILECGQIFTYKKNADFDYDVYSWDKFANVKKENDTYVIYTNSPEYFVNFFDLDTDYGAIKKELYKDEKMRASIDYGYGIRILKQNIYEIIIGFILSANNNIERIKGIMIKIRELGENKGNYYAFPSIERLLKVSEQEFKNMGAGYRASYLVQTIKVLSETNIEETFSYPTNKLKEWLLSLQGVGPKVADCILLFGYKRSNSFPVDTWIEKVYFDLFGLTKSRNEMATDLLDYFKEYAGYAQQYLFFYKRNFDK